MFNDIETAAEEMVAFRHSQTEASKPRSIEFDVTVLSASAWPTYPDIPVRLPPKIERSMKRFEEFYRGKRTGRKLSWKHQLAHCQLNAIFGDEKKQLVVSSFQTVVLLLFNDVPDGESLQYSQIKEATGLCK